MVGLRFAIPAVLIAAAVAAYVTYCTTPSSPQRSEADLRLQPAAPEKTVRPVTRMPAETPRQATEDHIATFERAVDAILKRAQNAKASAGGDEPIITGPVPLPRRRPILRP
jgi:hypothetical protein